MSPNHVFSQRLYQGMRRSHARTIGVASDDDAPTVNRIVLAFWRHAQTYYCRTDGTPTAEVDNYHRTLRPLKQLKVWQSINDFTKVVNVRFVNASLLEPGLGKLRLREYVVDVEVISHINEWKQQRQHGEKSFISVLHLDKFINLFIAEE